MQAYMEYIEGHPNVMIGPEIPDSAIPGAIDVSECEEYFGIIKAQVGLTLFSFYFCSGIVPYYR